MIITRLDVIKPDVIKKLLKTKIGNIIALYKKWKDKIEQTRWGINIKKYDQAANNNLSLIKI